MRFLLLFFALFSSSVSACAIGPYVYHANVTSVYDADTVTVNIEQGFHTWRIGEKLRLFGIDAPEVKGPTRVEGKASRDWLRERILDKRIIIRTIKDGNKWRGKFGRYLAVIYDEECVNLNDKLVELGLAVHRDY